MEELSSKITAFVQDKHLYPAYSCCLFKSFLFQDKIFFLKDSLKLSILWLKKVQIFVKFCRKSTIS